MNICIVEDNVALLENLRDLLGAERDIEVVAAYVTAEEAIEAGHWNMIDILLVDIDLPKMSGINLIKMIHPTHPDVGIFVYTVHEDRSSVLDAIRAGASGYVIKGSTPNDLVTALREIYAGGAPMSPKIARSVLAELRMDTPLPEVPPEEQLTAREVVIMRLLEDGHSYKEISTKLGVSPHTIHTHIKNIYKKLHAHDKVEAIRKSRVRGVL